MNPAADGRGAGARSRAPRGRTAAFGLDLQLNEPVTGLTLGATSAAEGRRAIVEVVSEAELAERWIETGSITVGQLPIPASPDAEIRFHERAGFLLRPPDFGRHLVSPDGRLVSCWPPAGEAWDWQRLLIGQLLPLAAALQGLEALHASAVVLDGKVLAFSGPPGMGKSALALHLVLRGAELLAEDVLVVEATHGGLRAYPGAGVMNLRATEARLVLDGRTGQLGARMLGETDKLHMVLATKDVALPLTALYLLMPPTTDGETIERVPAPGLRELFETLFVPYVTLPRQLVGHMDIADQLARTVSVYRVAVDHGMGVERLAELVAEQSAREHAEAGT